MVEHLLQAGADPNVRTKRGNSVFDALFRPRNFVPGSWDASATVRLLLAGHDRWSPVERRDGR